MLQHIFIHGLGQTPTSWEKTIEGIKVQTNFGCPNLSEMLQDKDVNYTNLYHAFCEYCNTFSEPLAICGLSLGGILALHYGINHPAKVNSLVLIGTQYIMPKKLLTLQNMIFRLMPKSMFQQMGFGKKEFIELSKSMMELDFSQELRKISCPVLVICGERDNANKKASEELAEYLPHAEFQIIENAGHEVNTATPERLAEILNNFYVKAFDERFQRENLLFYDAYEQFYSMAADSKAFKAYCEDAFGADFSQDGFSDLQQINTILSFFPKREDLHILDIGCGNGKMLMYLQDKTSAYIHGFDYSENAIQTAIAQSKGNADFRVGVIGEIEYPKESFDVVTAMDSLYFAKDMSQFVGQVHSWLKADGLFVIGYQEGDIMSKTEDSETTVIAQALRKNQLKYNVIDITEDTYRMLKRKRESILKFREAFAGEGLEAWFEMVVGQTDCAMVSLEEYRANNARYIYVATK